MKKTLLCCAILGFISCAYSETTKEYFLYWGLRGNIKKITSETRKVGADGHIVGEYVFIQENEYDEKGKSVLETLYSVFKGKRQMSMRSKFDYDDNGRLIAKIILDEKGETKGVAYVEESETQRKFTDTSGNKVNFIIIENKKNNRIISTSNVDMKSGKVTSTTTYKFDKFGSRIGWHSDSGGEGSNFEIVERDKHNNPTKVYVNNVISRNLIVYFYEYYD